MANIYFKCSCGKSLAVDEAGIGRTVKCTDCGKPITIPQPEIECDCNCGKTMLAPKNMAGEKVQCVECQHYLIIAMPSDNHSQNEPGNTNDFTPVVKKSIPSHSSSRKLIIVSCKSCKSQMVTQASTNINNCVVCDSDKLSRDELDGDISNIIGNIKYHYYVPSMQLDEVKSHIIAYVSNAPSGDCRIQDANIELITVYYPFWNIDLSLNCNWHGENYSTKSEIRTRTVKKKVAERCIGKNILDQPEYQDVYEDFQEPYEEQVTISTTVEGTKLINSIVDIKAANAFEDISWQALGGLDSSSQSKELASLSDTVIVMPKMSVDASLSGSKNEITSLMEMECKGCCDAIIGVSANNYSYEIKSLRFIPVADAKYSVGKHKYHNMFSFGNQTIIGDYPLTHTAMVKELVSIHDKLTERLKWDKRLEGMPAIFLQAGIAIVFAIYVIVFLIYNDKDTAFISAVILTLIVGTFGSLCAGVVLLGIFRLILKLCETFHSGQNIQAVWLKYLKEREGFLLKYYKSSSEVTTMVDRMLKESLPSEIGKSIEGGNSALLHAIAEAFIQKEHLKTQPKGGVDNGSKSDNSIIVVVGACVFIGAIFSLIIFGIYNAAGSVISTLKCIGVVAGIIAVVVALIIMISRLRLKAWLILLGIAALIGIGVFIVQMLKIGN